MTFIHNMAYPVVRSEGTAFRIIDNEAVILNLNSGIYYSLNEVGAKAWELCDGSHSMKDIATVICKEFEVQEKEAEKDILELMSDLLKEGLVDIYENPEQVESH